MSQTTTAPVERPLGRSPWLVFAALVFHVFEEWPEFPEWATRHFGTTSAGFFLVSHAPILILVGLATWSASRPAAPRWSIWALTMILGALGTNVLFHVGASLLLGELAPGLFTAVLLYVPVLVYLLPKTMRSLGRRRSVLAIGVGILVAAIITGTLWLDVPLFSELASTIDDTMLVSVENF